MKTIEKECPRCRKMQQVTVTDEGYELWLKGEYIDKVLPHGTADEREVLISGTCPKCWDEMYAEDEDEDPNVGDAWGSEFFPSPTPAMEKHFELNTEGQVREVGIKLSSTSGGALVYPATPKLVVFPDALEGGKLVFNVLATGVDEEDAKKFLRMMLGSLALLNKVLEENETWQ